MGNRIVRALETHTPTYWAMGRFAFRRVLFNKRLWKRCVVAVLAVVAVVTPVHLGLTFYFSRELAKANEAFAEKGYLTSLEDLRTRWPEGAPPPDYDESRARDEAGYCATDYLVGPPLLLHEIYKFPDDFHKKGYYATRFFYTCTAEQEAELRRVMAETAPLLDKIVEICELEPARPEWSYASQTIDEKGLAAMKIPYLLECRAYANLLTVKSFLAFSDGNADHALELTRRVLEFSNHVKDTRSLIGLMIAVAIDAIALEYAVNLAQYAEFSPEATQRFIEELDRSSRPETFAYVLEIEQLFARELMNESEPIEAFGLPSREQVVLFKLYVSPLFAPLRYWDELTLTRAYEAGLEYARTPFHRAHGLEEEYTRQMRRGGPITRMAHPSIARARLSQTERDAMIVLAKTVLALRAYYGAHLEYPDRLAALGGGVLAELPVSPFTGEALDYARHGRGFYLAVPNNATQKSFNVFFRK